MNRIISTYTFANKIHYSCCKVLEETTELNNECDTHTALDYIAENVQSK